MKVLVLQHAAAEGLGRLAPALASRGLEVELVGPDDALEVSTCSFDALVVLGGPMGVHEAPAAWPRRDAELALVGRALTDDLPMLGICLGSQLLAHALGADVTRGARRELGWLDVELTAEAATDPLFGGLPARLCPLHWHGDVFSLPASTTLLARSAQTAHQAFRHGRAWGLLFHLEADVGAVEAMADAFPDEVHDVGLTKAGLLVETERRADETTRHASQVFGRFADLVLAR